MPVETRSSKNKNKSDLSNYELEVVDILLTLRKKEDTYTINNNLYHDIKNISNNNNNRYNLRSNKNNKNNENFKI